MTPLEWLALVTVVAAALWLRHLWHVHRYPHRACSGCDGSGKATSTDWLGRVVIGVCRRCGGVEPTKPRRWTS